MMQPQRLKTIGTVAALAVLLATDCASAYYSPRLGRWLSRDPIGEHGGKNLYESMRNDPADAVDPDGRACVRSVFPRVTVQKIKNAVGHEWLNISFSAYHGFYPVDEEGIPLLVKGSWYDESTILWPVGQIPDPDTPGLWKNVYQPRYLIVLLNNWYDEWDTRRRCTGTLAGSKAASCSCAKATDQEILDCLRSRTAPGTPGLYCLIGGNCIDHVNSALADCCLRRNNRIHTGNPVPTGGSSGGSGG